MFDRRHTSETGPNVRDVSGAPRDALFYASATTVPSESGAVNIPFLRQDVTGLGPNTGNSEYHLKRTLEKLGYNYEKWKREQTLLLEQTTSLLHAGGGAGRGAVNSAFLERPTAGLTPDLQNWIASYHEAQRDRLKQKQHERIAAVVTANRSAFLTRELDRRSEQVLKSFSTCLDDNMSSLLSAWKSHTMQKLDTENYAALPSVMSMLSAPSTFGVVNENFARYLMQYNMEKYLTNPDTNANDADDGTIGADSAAKTEDAPRKLLRLFGFESIPEAKLRPDNVTGVMWTLVSKIGMDLYDAFAGNASHRKQHALDQFNGYKMAQIRAEHQQTIINASLQVLELHAYDLAEQLVGKSTGLANTTVSRFVKSHILPTMRRRGFEMEDGYVDEAPVWALMYYALRMGDIPTLERVASDTDGQLGMKKYASELAQLGGRSLTEESRDELRRLYDSTARYSRDVYKQATICVLAKFDPFLFFDPICESATDFIWLMLSQVSNFSPAMPAMPTSGSGAGKEAVKQRRQSGVGMDSSSNEPTRSVFFDQPVEHSYGDQHGRSGGRSRNIIHPSLLDIQQRLLNEYGEKFFLKTFHPESMTLTSAADRTAANESGGSAELDYFMALMCCGLFEEALQQLSRVQEWRVHALHMSLALTECGLLTVVDNNNYLTVLVSPVQMHSYVSVKARRVHDLLSNNRTALGGDAFNTTTDYDDAESSQQQISSSARRTAADNRALGIVREMEQLMDQITLPFPAVNVPFLVKSYTRKWQHIYPEVAVHYALMLRRYENAVEPHQLPNAFLRECYDLMKSLERPDLLLRIRTTTSAANSASTGTMPPLNSPSQNTVVEKPGVLFQLSSRDISLRAEVRLLVEYLARVEELQGDPLIAVFYYDVIRAYISIFKCLIGLMDKYYKPAVTGSFAGSVEQRNAVRDLCIPFAQQFADAKEMFINSGDAAVNDTEADENFGVANNKAAVAAQLYEVFYIYLDLFKFYDRLADSQLDRALMIVDSLRLVPLQEATVDECLRTLQRTGHWGRKACNKIFIDVVNALCWHLSAQCVRQQQHHPLQQQQQQMDDPQHRFSLLAVVEFARRSHIQHDPHLLGTLLRAQEQIAAYAVDTSTAMPSQLPAM